MSLDPKSQHYDAGGIETIDIIAAKLTPEQYVGYLLGNVIKYACRANWKGASDRDIDKLKVYAGLLSEVSMGAPVLGNLSNTPLDEGPGSDASD